MAVVSVIFAENKPSWFTMPMKPRNSAGHVSHNIMIVEGQSHLN